MKQIHFAALVCLSFFPVFASAQAPTAPNLLSDEGLARQEAHAYLFDEFSKDKESTYRGEGENRNLVELVLSNETLQLSGDVSIELPAGSQRVASLFKYIILRGENLNHLGGIEVAPYSGGGTVERSTQEPKLYRFKLPAMPVPSEKMPPIRIRTRCADGKTATVTQIAFNSQGKLPVKFDDAFRSTCVSTCNTNFPSPATSTWNARSSFAIMPHRGLPTPALNDGQANATSPRAGKYSSSILLWSLAMVPAKS